MKSGENWNGLQNRQVEQTADRKKAYNITRASQNKKHTTPR